MESGFLVFLVLAVMGGIIAFIGDKLGSKVGKKRISLFGMRPRHTSILVTIVTGILIALLTIGVMSILSENVRVALFGMEELRAKMTSLSSEVQHKTEELEEGKALLAERTKEYDLMTKRLNDTNRELAQAEEQQRYMSDQLMVVEEAYRKAQADINTSAEEIRMLEETKVELTDNIDKLNKEAERLRTGIITVREGRVMFRVGEVLSSAVVESNLSLDESLQVVASILYDTNMILQERLNVPEDTDVIRILPDELEKAAVEMSESKNKKLVRVVASGNIIVGEPAWVEFVLFDNKLVFEKGDVVLARNIQTYDSFSTVEAKVLTFLRDVNHEATKNGVVPDPITGNVGQVDGKQLFATIQEITRKGGNVNIKAVAKRDIYTEGPVSIDIVVSEG